jgi:hypothetical protein
MHSEAKVVPPFAIEIRGKQIAVGAAARGVFADEALLFSNLRERIA